MSGSLVAGVYSGAVTRATILDHGDFGLGTFAGLDGEMVVLEGRVYRVRATGKVSEAALAGQAPFAIVTTFAPSVDEQIDAMDSFDAIKRRLDGYRRSDNLFYPIRIDGAFKHVRTRAVSPPKNHGRLLDAAKAQKEFDFKHAEGTLVGIYSPSFSGAFSVLGYHFHFISTNRLEGN